MRPVLPLACMLLLALVVHGGVRAEVPPPDFCVVTTTSGDPFVWVYRRQPGHDCDHCRLSTECDVCAYVGKDDVRVSLPCILP